jgi:hypothetical protein
MQHNKASVRACALVLTVAAATVSCTRTVEIPLTRLEGVDPESGIAYEFQTTEQGTIVTDRFSVADSGFLVRAVIRDGKRRDVEPFEIPVDEVGMLRRIETSPVKTTFAVLAGGAVVWGLAVIAADFVGNLGGLD